MKRLSSLAMAVLAVSMLVNIGGATYYVMLHHRFTNASRPADRAVGSIVPVRAGMDMVGKNWQSLDAPCRVIRITNDDCLYCKRDKPQYSKLLDVAQNASCEILETAPRAGQMAPDPRPGIVQLKFVDADLGESLSPFVTPTTIVLDRTWLVRWSRRGYLDEKSLMKGIASIQALESGSPKSAGVTPVFQ